MAAQVGFMLPVKKIQVRPIKRKGQWLPDWHSGSFLYDNSYITFGVPSDAKTGRRVNVLTRDEREFFEDPTRSGLDFKPGDLSENKRENNFWDTFEVQLKKNTEELDLSDPMEYLKYCVLRANTGPHGLVAKDWDSRFDYPTCKYALVEADYDAQQGSRRAEDKLAAYKFFSTIEDSQDKLYDFLTVYWLENRRARKPAPNATKTLLRAEVEDIIGENIKGFLAIVNDPNGYERKLFLHRAIQNGHVDYNGRDTYKLMPDGIIIGATLSEALDYLYNPKNQEMFLRIRALIEQQAGK